MNKPPKIDNAPGIIWRPLKRNGWMCRWQARFDLMKQGFLPKSWKLWSGPLEQLDDTVIAFIQDRATALQDEMHAWANGGLPINSQFDGTLRSLIYCYQNDADSPYKRKLRFRTRQNYDALLRRIANEHGDEQIAEIKPRQVLRWYDEWVDGTKFHMAHGLIGILRTLVNFGATMLESEECGTLAGHLHRMRFTMPKPREHRLTAEQANAVRVKVRAMGFPSVALAQAFQFEIMLRQKDVIGEWVPIPEPGVSDVTAGNEKWLRGIRWEEIDQNLTLRHTTSKRQKLIEVSLMNAPMVVEELTIRFGGTDRALMPASGPIIVSEEIDRPYHAGPFRRIWRKAADACGIPKEIFNMDSRAGAISEATDAGAELEHVRHAATHSDIAMTTKYSRGAAGKIANVQQLRNAHRNKTERND